MKLKNYLLLGCVTVFAAACSSNDDNNNQQMTLQRVEEYYPSKTEYENAEWKYQTYKDVKYYENGEVVLDSFFDGTTGYYSREVVQTTQSTKTRTQYDINKNIQSTVTYRFDTQGRLIQTITPAMSESSSDIIDNFSYNSDGTITYTSQQPQFEQESQQTYVTNDEGRIIGSIYEGLIHNEMVYENGNIISINGKNLTYYDIKKPSNLRMNIIQVNNYLLGYSWFNNSLGVISDNYIKAFEDNLETYQSTFNNSGYILHTNWEGAMSTAIGTKEFFYYYN